LDQVDRKHVADLNVTEFLRLCYDSKLLDSKAGSVENNAVEQLVVSNIQRKKQEKEEKASWAAGRPATATEAVSSEISQDGGFKMHEAGWCKLKPLLKAPGLSFLFGFCITLIESQGAQW
jgi:hypothetical protein